MHDLTAFALSILLGAVLCQLFLLWLRRVRQYREIVGIKNRLVQLVRENERISELYPPKYLTKAMDPRKIVNKTSIKAVSDTQNVVPMSVDAELSQVREGIRLTVENSHSPPMQYAVSKSGKMLEQIIKICQVVELEHSASLLHDDVVDESDLRRGVESHRKLFGDRTAVLTGDNLISLLVDILAEIDNMQITSLVAHSIEALVVGELLQLVNGVDGGSAASCSVTGQIIHVDVCNSSDAKINNKIHTYIKKSYFKTASLFACVASCVSVTLPQPLQSKVAAVGFYFGLAFQLVDDLLDFTDTDCSAGKPTQGADLKNGTVTLPVLLGALSAGGLEPQEREEMMAMIHRKFKLAGDCERGMQLVKKSNGVAETRKVVHACFDHCRSLLLDVRSSWDCEDRAMESLFQLFRDYETRSH